MKVHTLTVFDIESGEILHDEFYEYSGPVALCDRAAQSAAANAAKNADSRAAVLGSEAQGIQANLTPFLTQEMEHPQGYSQADNSAMLTAAESGAGGATSGITGEANLATARTRNASGFVGALDDAARQRQKALAAAAEAQAANNAELKQKQQQAGAEGLTHMYGTEQAGMLGEQQVQADEIKNEIAAGQSGWFQNMTGLMSALGDAAQGYRAIRGSK